VVTNAGVVPVGAIVPQLKGSGLEKIILKCCSQEPSKRYQNCAELMYALEHAHEEDDSAIQHRNRVWKAFLICAIFTLLLLFVGGGSRLMAMNKRTQLYKQYVQTASANVNFSDKLALYKKAIDLDPGNPEAYQKLIDDIDSLLDDEFVAAYNSITDCINGVDYDPASRKRNIEYLNDRDAATYSDFNFRLGTLVYLVYPSGQGASISYLNEAVESKGLAEDRQESAELILRLAELYKKTKEAGAGGNARKIEFEHEFADYWATLDDLSIRLDTLKSQTNIGYPVRICDTIATEINLHCVNYMNDNVSRDTILQTLDRANNFMNNAKSSSPDQLEVIKRVRSNVTKAYGSVDDCFSNTSNVNPDAAGSEEEGGDV
jgi:serine/threonine-protein kinase